jgi:hypothetical protein
LIPRALDVDCKVCLQKYKASLSLWYHMRICQQSIELEKLSTIQTLKDRIEHELNTLEITNDELINNCICV